MFFQTFVMIYLEKVKEKVDIKCNIYDIFVLVNQLSKDYHTINKDI